MKLDGAQIAILMVVAVVLVFYLKYKISGSIKGEFRLIGRILDRFYPFIAMLACLASIGSAAFGVMAIADVLMPAGVEQSAVVTGKEKFSRARNGHDYRITAGNDTRTYSEGVSALLYSKVSDGDVLQIAASPVFGEWKSVRVIRNGRTIYQGRGMDIYAMLIMGILFVATLYSFRLYFRMASQRVAGSIVFIVIILFESIPLTMAVMHLG